MDSSCSNVEKKAMAVRVLTVSLTAALMLQLTSKLPIKLILIYYRHNNTMLIIY